MYKAASAAMKGLNTFEDILKSDNDETFGRESQVKKKKVYDSELEQPKCRRKDPCKATRLDGAGRTGGRRAQEPHRTMMDLDTHQLYPSNEMTLIQMRLYVIKWTGRQV